MNEKTNLSIRRATLEDLSVVARFNTALALETESIHLHPDTILAGARTLLSDPAKGTYWVAEVDGRVVGQIMITHEWSDWRNGDIWWIQSVYVETEFRRRGVFRALYAHVRNEARIAGAVALRLYVVDDNLAAQKTYRSLGMRMSNYRVMGEKLDDSSSPEFE